MALDLPFVSVCTPTFNRRPFINQMIRCFDNQTYPKDKIEWIIIDDGTDKIADLIKDHPQVKYFSYEEKMPLGKKRNLMHKKSKGDIIVYMDDDDYYPPDRISHSVEMLLANPSALCAGTSEIYIYFKHINKIIQFGPYGPNHATAGTFAFRRELLKEHKYDDNAALAEEKAFLKNYTVPFIQLDPMKTILVFSHDHNTFDKRKLLESPHPKFVKESDKTVDMFIKDESIRQFYIQDIEGLLADYEPGRPDMKPDVLKQIIEIEERRRKEAEAMASKMASQGNILIQQGEGPPQLLNTQQTISILKQQQEFIQKAQQQMKQMEATIQQKDYFIQLMQEKIKNLQMKEEKYDKLLSFHENVEEKAGVSLKINEKKQEPI